MAKIILLAGDGASTPIIYHYLCNFFDVEAVIIESGTPLVEFIMKRIRRLGLMKVCGQILFTLFVVKFQRYIGAKRIEEIKKKNNLKDEPIEATKIINISSVNSQETIDIIKKIAPTIVVVYGTSIIDGRVLDSIPAKFINIHTGITPLYRGVHGGYWALAQRDPQNCGVTIHLVDTGIDTGGILGQGVISPEKQDCFVTYPYLQIAAGLPILKRAIEEILENNSKIKKVISSKSKFWTHPTIVEYLWYRKRYGVR